MARIRSIKPEFWTSLDIASLSRDCRLFFVGLWNYADDAGRGVADPRLLKAAVFPLDDDVDSSRIRRMLDELSSGGLIALYEARSRPMFQVVAWHHQKIDRPGVSKLPPPPESASNQHLDAFVEDSSNVRRGLVEDSSLDQGSGIRDQGDTSTDQDHAVSPTAAAHAPSVKRSDAARVFGHWKQVMGKNGATKLDAKRETRIRWALTHYPEADVIDAINGCAATPWNMGENRDGKRYDDLELILRDAKHLEGFRDTARRRSTRKPQCGRWTDGGDPARLPSVDDIRSGAYQPGPARF